MCCLVRGDDPEISPVLVRSMVTDRQTEQTRLMIPAPTLWSVPQRCLPMRQTIDARLGVPRPGFLRLTVTGYLIEW